MGGGEEEGRGVKIAGYLPEAYIALCYNINYTSSSETGIGEVR